MSEHNKVVVRYLNGDVLKGTTQDFFPNRPLFHLQPQAGDSTIDVRSRDLKAVFFVKDFSGHPQRQDVPGFLAAPSTVNQGRKVAVRFKDGEIICGYSMTFTPGREGFFVFPADAEGNNLRIYVLSEATSDVKIGPAAEALVRSILQGPQAA